MDKLILRGLVLKFLDAAMVSIEIENETGDEYLTKSEVLAMWASLPDCQLSGMCLGYVLALGYDINSFTPTNLESAVQAASVLGDDVKFDWLGDCDATNKPH